MRQRRIAEARPSTGAGRSRDRRRAAPPASARSPPPSAARRTSRGRGSALACQIVLVPQQEAEVGERRVAAVQQAQLHRLERRDVGGELRARRPPRAAARPANRSSITHWAKGSATTGAASATPRRAAASATSAAVVAGTMRSTIVFGNATLDADPLGERGVARLRERADDPFDGAAVVRKVVAADDGERARAGGAPRRETRGEQADRRHRRLRGARGRGRCRDARGRGGRSPGRGSSPSR